MDTTLLTEIVTPTLEVIGHIMVAIVVLNVHTRVAKEHKIDKAVIRYMYKERIIAVIGILFIITGYIIDLLV